MITDTANTANRRDLQRELIFTVPLAVAGDVFDRIFLNCSFSTRCLG